MNKGKKYSSRRKMRMILVMIVYQFELMNEKVSIRKIFEESQVENLFDYYDLFKKDAKQTYIEQMRILKFLEKHYELLKVLVTKFVREDWTWTRISPLVRSILLCACIELKKLDLGIVSNEYVSMTRDFIPGSDEYKFVNIVIEKVEKFYHEKNLKASNPKS